MSALYYSLQEEYEPKLTGIRNASSQALLERKLFIDKEKYDQYIDFFLAYKEDWFYKQTRFPDEDFDLQYLKLKKSTILNDFLYFGPSYYHRFLVNEKVQGILTEFNVAPFKYYSARLFRDEKLIDGYKFLFSPSFNYDVIDFKSCVFSKGNTISEREYFFLKTLEEYQAAQKPLNKEKIVLKSGFNKSLDFFNILIFPDPIISKRLAEEFVRQKVTGIRLSELDVNNFQIE
jgi:hypothetical protein